MSGLLSTGVSALLAFRRNLTVTGHNISNANTPGYSRQRVGLTERNPTAHGNGFVGNGVKVETVRRLYSGFLASNVRTTAAGQSRLDAFHGLASNLDNLLAGGDAGLAPALQSLYSSFEDVGNDPASIPVRQSLLSGAKGATNRFHHLDERIDAIGREANQRIKSAVSQVNGLAHGIARLNRRIEQARGAAGGQPPNDLLDQRDRLVDELSQQVAVKTVRQDNGSDNVFIGNGQALVLGNRANELATQRDSHDPTRLDITLNGGANPIVVTGQLHGGALGGAVDARREVIAPARATLGLAAVGLANSVNAQHHQGMDLNGKLGGDFFAISPSQVLPDQANGGAANVKATVGDVSQLTGDATLLQYDGANWSLERADTGEAVPLTGSGTSADPFVAEGVNLVISGTAAAGDSFVVRPVGNAAASLSAALDDPASVAAAAPIRTAAAGSNAGGAQISAGTVVDPADPGLLNTATISFTSATSYTINGGPPQSFSSGGTISANGWQATITGAPEAGDTFTVASNAGGVGDNRNALKLGALQSQGVLDDGNTSISDTYQQLVAAAGTQTRQAKVNLDAQEALATQANAAKQSLSGVNLDEEAANLVRYQQSYMAAARTISVSKTVFNSLLRAFN